MKAVSRFTNSILLRKCSLLLASILLMTGCSASTGQATRTTLAWGPLSEDLSAVPVAKATYAPESRAAKLRDDVLARNSDAPTTKDWVMRRGPDKGPTIFGAALKFDLSEGDWSMNLGAVRRGTNKTYGPQLIMELK